MSKSLRSTVREQCFVIALFALNVIFYSIMKKKNVENHKTFHTFGAEKYNYLHVLELLDCMNEHINK